MTRPLREAMEEILAGWPADLDPAWRPQLADTTLGFADIDASLVLEPWEPVFPARRGRRFPGAPVGAHMLRAFDGIEPDTVRCVILGQDPYPCPAFATGRAFEPGNVASWREFEKMFSCSMRTLLQLICAAHTGNPDYARDIGAWGRMIADIEAGRLIVPAPAGLLDGWVKQGVLALNSALTLTRFVVEGDPHQLRGHLPLWRPLVAKVLRHLASRRSTPIVFLGFGACAAELLTAAEVPQDTLILRDHPAAGNAVLAAPNPLVLCNDLLRGRGAAPIAWA